jgi:hypothetical protein
MRGMALVLLSMAVLATTPACAFDATGADIIGLRLGMPEVDLVAGLKRQGFLVRQDKGTLTATTRDGQITVQFAGDLGAQEIRYVFTGRLAGEPEKIRASVIDRFGAPDQAKPMTWCRAVGHDGLCPDDHASLTFKPESVTLLLRGAQP